LKLVEESDVVAVEPIEMPYVVELLKKKLGIQSGSNDNDNNSDISELAVALEYMPLAIVQAVAYIFQREPRYSVR
jgi:hypothetical protein